MLSAVPPLISSEIPSLPRRASMPLATAVSQFLPAPEAVICAVLSCSAVRLTSRALRREAPVPTVTPWVCARST